MTWNTAPGQFGTAVFVGFPNPVLSRDGAKIWDNPTAFVTCWIDWYEENFGLQAYYRWEIEDYGGEVRNCTSPRPNTLPAVEYDTEYDPYQPYDPIGTSNCSNPLGGNGGGGGAGGDGGGCRVEYVYVDISFDGGASWTLLWEGWATLC